MAGSEKKFNQYTNPGTLQNTDIFPFARAPFGSGTSFKTSMADVKTYIGTGLIDVGLGEVAVGLADGTLAGFSAFTYDAGDQKVVVENARISLFLTAGVVHNDSNGNLMSSLLVDADVNNSAAISFSKINTSILGVGYHEITDGLSYNETLPMHTVINVTNAGGGLAIFLPDMTSPLAFQANKQPSFCYYNNGTQQIDVLDNALVTLVSIKPGEGYQFTVKSNASAAGLFTFQRILLPAASSTLSGYVTTGTQTFSGNKTFTGTIAASNLSNTNTGDISLSNVGVTPNAAGMTLTAQALNLQPADGTNPGVLSAGAQTIGGVKTLTSNLILNNSNSIGIGTTTPDASALIDLVSTTRGFGLNVMTATQKNAIATPKSGLMIYESSSAVPWINLIAFGWVPFVVGSLPINQMMVSSGPGLAGGSSALTVSSGTVLNTLAGAAFRGTGSNSYFGIGANSSGTNGTMFGEANTATTFFSSTAAGDSVLRNSDTTKFVRIGVGSGTAQLNVGNTFAYIQTALGIATTSPVAPLGFSTSVVSRKISFSGGSNDHQDQAMGTTATSLRYQVQGSTFSHVFQAGISGVASLEIMRMIGNGQVAIGTASPNAASIFQIDSTTMAFLPPRMTTTQKNAITTPPSGSIVYDSTLGKLCVFGAATWETITSI